MKKLNTYAALVSYTLTGLTSTEGCAPCQEAARQTTRVTYDDEGHEAGEQPLSSHWRGPIVIEGQLTGDGRLIEKDALEWGDLPLPFRFVRSDVGAHDGAVVVGRITSLTRDGGQIIGEGDFDLGSEDGAEAVRHVREGLTTGVSVDLDSVSFEVRIARDLLEADMEPEGEEDEDGHVTVLEIDSDDEIMVTTSARIRAATLVAIPAFADARIELTDDETEPEPTEEDTLVASAIPEVPPASWFDVPQFEGPTGLTVTEEGRIYGHLAAWGTCHIAHGQHTGECIQPPTSPSGYSYFHTGTVLTKEGAQIPVGHITLDAMHASTTVSPTEASAHYERTGVTVADVVAGEDSYGIWVAGALRSNVTPEQVRELRAAPLSGDWRRIAGSLELVAALAVNVPGFPIPRPKGLVAGGALASLVASGMVPPRQVRKPGTPGALDEDDLRYLKRLAARERHNDQMSDLRQRVNASKLAMRAAAIRKGK